MQVVQAPDHKLRVETKPVKKITASHHKIIQEMIKLTKTFTDPEGVGLAATQIGNDEQYFIAKLEDGSFKAFFNPRILSYGKRAKTFFEGCLSIPNYYGDVERPTSVLVSYMTEDGKVIKKERLHGVIAWIFQHEFDHLNGKLFMDRIMEQKSRLFKVVGRDRAGAEVFEEVPL